MRYQFYREHKYVSSALNDLERLIAQTDFCDSASLEGVKRSFEDLAEMLKGHAQYENERLHVLLNRKNSTIPACRHVEEEHAAQDAQLSQIGELIQGISLESDEEKKIERGYQLYLAYRHFVADNLAHLHEEETQILPELQRLYSDSELQQVEAGTYREMTPDQMIAMMNILFPHMNRQDRQAFLVDILSLEPEKFEVVWQSIQFSIAETERLAIQRKMKNL
ncbi:MAG: hemerythrin domain-containing protein [Verrucomicrobia bacterium]|nr:hemerythrin domain-containing protein [Verrucomicrobiota bacterium]